MQCRRWQRKTIQQTRSVKQIRKPLLRGCGVSLCRGSARGCAAAGRDVLSFPSVCPWLQVYCLSSALLRASVIRCDSGCFGKRAVLAACHKGHSLCFPVWHCPLVEKGSVLCCPCSCSSGALFGGRSWESGTVRLREATEAGTVWLQGFCAAAPWQLLGLLQPPER